MKQISFPALDSQKLYAGIQEIEEYKRSHQVSELLFHLYCGVSDK